MSGKYLAVLILMALLVLFLVLNSGAISVNFLLFQLQTSKAILILIAAIIGFLIGAALTHSIEKKPKTSR